MTLVELLAVMAIIVILIGLLGPAIKGISSTAGRKGAVNILMNTLEQARSAALESGCNVYVILWRRSFPEQDTLLVMRDPSPWNDETGLQPLTRWIDLPSQVLLHDPNKGDNVFKAGLPADDKLPANFWEQLPKRGSKSPTRADADQKLVGLIRFNPSGAITYPTNTMARIIVSEGVRDTNGTEALISTSKQKQSGGGGFDLITLSRFTGRAQLDVTTL